MPSSTSTLTRIDEFSHRAAAVAQGLPHRWQDALSDWLARLGHPRHDDLWQLNEHALRDIGLSRRDGQSAGLGRPRLGVGTGRDAHR